LDGDPNGLGAGVSTATSPWLSAGSGIAFFECPDGTLFTNDRNHALDIVARNINGGSTELISAEAGALPSLSANGHSSLGAGAMSDDGRFVAFASEADNLVANDTNQCADIFVRDLITGTNLLVSFGTNGAIADGSSSEAVISGNGRFAAFTSSADNLVTNDANHALDVFERDLTLGITLLVSVNSNGTASANGKSMSPVLSSDGRYVLFLSSASDLLPGMVRIQNLFLRDTQAGVTYALTQRGVSAYAMTPDGRYVAVAGQNSGTAFQLYVWDSQAAAFVYTNPVSGLASSISYLAINHSGNRIAYANAPGLQVIDWMADTNWSIAPYGALSSPEFSFTSDHYCPDVEGRPKHFGPCLCGLDEGSGCDRLEIFSTFWSSSILAKLWGCTLENSFLRRSPIWSIPSNFAGA
jgi:Tol biopolymer transport system component